MKKYLFIPILIFFFSSQGASITYYVSNSGSDLADGRTSATPFQTIAKAMTIAYLAGDHILLKRGDSWHEQLKITRNGAAGAPIVFGAYGTGANPLISGFTSISAWSNLGSNIWESTSAVSTLSQLNMVVINGVNYAMGRTPNSGYLTYQSAVGQTSITSSSLTGSPNWTGAEAVARRIAWITDRNVITSQSGGTLSFTAPYGSTYNGIGGWGFFIQNDTKTLDVQNEWYYNPSTKKIRIYSTSSPTNVQVSTIDTLCKIQSVKYITIDGIDFKGSNQDAITISADHITIQNCNIDFSGKDAVWGGQNITTSPGFIFQNNTINHTNGNALLLRSYFNGALVQNNTIKNTGVQPGMINRLINGNSNGIAIQLRGDNQLAQYNIVDSSGFIGIGFWANSDTVQKNLVDHSLLTISDGGGIYSYVGDVGVGTVRWTGDKVYNNIVLNTYGQDAGSVITDLPQGQGIYLDDLTSYVEIAGNSVAGGRSAGLFLHNDSLLNIHDNTFYDNGRGTQFSSDNVNHLIRNTTLKNNIFVSKLSTQDIAYMRSATGLPELQAFGSPSTIDSNYWARPIDDNLIFKVKEASLFPPNKTLPQWKSYSLFDAHSSGTSKTVTSTDSILFVYNAHNYDSTVTLLYNYKDMASVQYNGQIVLGPYESAVLIQNGSITGTVPNVPPTANAGADQTITLPANSTGVSGLGSDVDGTIASRLWTQVSGTAATITTPTSSTTTITGLNTSGTRVFRFTVTDNNGATGFDDISVSVSPANIPPVANAGSDKNITLPTNSTSFGGSGSDADGSVSSYLWTQVSGPNTAGISTPTSASTSVSGLIQGTYQFQLQVTDNQGATGTDIVAVVVNPAPSNILPIAHAGSDQTIQLPTSSVSVDGSTSSDADGTISSYLWTASGGSITSSTSASTTITGLTAGVYGVQLRVTDNSGGISTDSLYVTVLPANISPVANAGSDNTFALPTTFTTLSGSGTDADGNISSYSWAQTAGSPTAIIASPNSANTSISGLTSATTYTFRLTVTDNQGATNTDLVNIIVTPKQGCNCIVKRRRKIQNL